MERLKVGILDPLGRHAGFHYYTEGLAEGLGGAGVDTTVYGFEAPETDGSAFRSVNAYHGLYGADPAWRRGLRYVGGLLSALKDARARRVGVMHMHSFHYDVREVMAAAAVKLFGFRLIVTLHDIDSFGKSHGRWGRRLILKLADGVVVHNAFSFEALKASGELAASKVSAVIPHGHYIDNYPRQPSRAAARADLNLPVDKIIALFFGNPRTEKGLDLLLDAAREIEDPRLLVVAAGKVRDEQLEGLRALEAGPLSGRLRLDPGHVSDADAERYYRAADMIVIPYRRIYESGVAIMGMSFGRCIVHSDLPPLVASVGEAGLGFRSEDADDLAARLREVLADPSALDRLGEAGKLRVEQTRGWPLIAEQTATAYAAVLKGGSPRA